LEGRDDHVVIGALSSSKAVLDRRQGGVGEGVVIGDDIAVKKIEVDVIALEGLQAPRKILPKPRQDGLIGPLPELAFRGDPKGLRPGATEGLAQHPL